MRLQQYTAREIKPCGWLKRQLKIQADGLNGNLDKVWRDVRESQWIGGDAEGWERVPYWLDGFIPLAYLLQDEDMILFGKETAGLPRDFIEAHREFSIRIPMSEDTRLRSLNLSNSASIVLFEALRQMGFPGLE